MSSLKYDPEKDIKLSFMPDDAWLKCDIRILDLFGTNLLYYEVQLTYCDWQYGERLINKLLIAPEIPLGQRTVAKLGRVLTRELARYTTSQLEELCKLERLNLRSRSRLMGELRAALKDRLSEAYQQNSKP